MNYEILKSNIIKSNLLTLISDCQVQADYLTHRNDVAWDCYDKDNWTNMVDQLKEFAECLSMDISEGESL